MRFLPAEVVMGIVLCVGMLSAASRAQGPTPPNWWVDQNVCPNPPDPQAIQGSIGNPFCSFQQAISSGDVQSGHTVWVIGWDAEGTVTPYMGPDNMNLTIQNKAIHLRCRSSEAGKCVIDIDPNNPGRAFNLGSLTLPGTIIEGFTIRNGRASEGAGILINGPSAANGSYPTIRGNVIEGCATTGSGNGAGIKVKGYANPLIEGNVLQNNVAANGGGGGISVEIIGNSNTPPVIVRWNVVKNNTAESGGGIFSASKILIENCVVEDNTATEDAGPDNTGLGGGIAIGEGTADGSVVRGCRVLRNSAGSSGGGIYLAKGGTITVVERSLIAGNSALQFGGGIAVTEAASVRIVNCEISNNTATSNFGGFAVTAGGGDGTLASDTPTYGMRCSVPRVTGTRTMLP